MKVAVKLSGTLALLLALMVALLVYHVQTMRDLVSISRDLSEISTSLVLDASTQLRRLTLLEENASKYGITRDPRYLERFNELLTEYGSTQAALEVLPVAGPEAEAVIALARDWEVSRPAFEEFAAAEVPLGTIAAELPPPLADRLEVLRSRTRGMAEVAEAMIGARNQRSAEAAREAERLSMLAAGGALLLSILVSVWIVRSISEALRQLQAGTRVVSGGDFSYRLPITKKDEFAALARDFNKMTQRLGELDRTQRDFLSKVSHDLKTPLASMRETTRLMLDGVPGTLNPAQRRLLLLSDQSGKRLASMIANILDLSGMEAGAFRLAPRRCELAPIVREATEQLEPMLREREVEITAALPTGPVPLVCDPDRLVQVLVNLLENAAKFSPAGGTVRVEAELPEDGPVDGGQLVLSVVDEGPGVPQEERERDPGFFEVYRELLQSHRADSAMNLVARLRRWRSVAIVSIALGAVGVAFLAAQLIEPHAQEMPPLISVPRADALTPPFVLAVDPEAGTLTVRSVPATNPPDRAYAFWLLRGDGPPMPLGRLRGAGVLKPPALAGIDRAALRESAIAVSVEGNDAPTERPGTPLVYRGGFE